MRAEGERARDGNRDRKEEKRDSEGMVCGRDGGTPMPCQGECPGVSGRAEGPARWTRRWGGAGAGGGEGEGE